MKVGARNDSDAEPAGAAGGVDLGHRRHRVGAPAQQQLVVVRLLGQRGDRHALRRRALDAHRPVDQLEVGARRLQLLLGEVEQLLAHVLGGAQHRAAVVERGLRARCAGVERAGVGVLVEHREVVGLHPQHLGGQHRQRHHGAGAALLGAGDDRARAVAVQLEIGARGDAERRPPGRGDADRLVVRQLLAVADHLDRLLQRLRCPDRIEHLPGRPLVALFDDRPAAKLDGVDAEPLGDAVHVLLERPGGLRRGGSADGAGGCGVGVHQHRVDGHVLDLVGADRHHRRQLGKEPVVRGVCAAVEDQPGAAGDQRAVAAGAGLDLDHLALSAVIGGHELLAARRTRSAPGGRRRGPARRCAPRSGTRTCRRSRRPGRERSRGRGPPAAAACARLRPGRRTAPGSTTRP